MIYAIMKALIVLLAAALSCCAIKESAFESVPKDRGEE